jgi:hypothetical protein
MNRNIIIIAIILIALVVLGVFLLLNFNPVEEKTLSVNGSKVSIINNNTDVWVYWDLEIQNVTLKNNTTQNFYVKAFVKPGENVTIDLSDMFGYENETLPADTNITVLAWGGVLNTTSGGTTTIDNTFLGWTVNQTIPEPPTYYKSEGDAINALIYNEAPQQTIGQLPSNVKDNTIVIGNSPEEVENNEIQVQQSFVQMEIIIDTFGIPHFKLGSTPTLCEFIAQL